ncbi:MAG: hypothetical protein MUF35_12130 [Candidatus Nanopelagicales bacterium]|nr:hypothetical protein [Candidatus Nanopelagicales bacterium]
MSQESIRTYGGWRERRGFGVAGLDGRGTAGAIGAAVAVLVVGMFSTTGLLVLTPALALVGAAKWARWRGEPLADAAARHVAFRRARRRGWSAHRAGLGRPPGAEWTLPGSLASTALLTALDESARPWAVVWDRRSGCLTGTWLVAPTSTWLVDPEQAETWVSAWHAWLAGLGYAPAVRHVAVTVETTPASPTALAGALHPRLDAAAPTAARQLIEDLLEQAPAAAASVQTRVSVTIDPSRSHVPLGDLNEQVAEFSRMLTGLSNALGGCGLTVLRRAGVADTIGWVRSAFDPAASDAVAAGGPDDAGWADARPIASDEAWDHYRSDSGHSISYGWDEAPRQAVPADVLTRLIAPGRWRKRVTLVLTPTPAVVAARELDLQAQAAVFRSQLKAKSGRDETARDLADRERARQAAAEEARGAGLVTVQAYATVTVLDSGDLPAAVADLEHRAEQSRIRLRRLYGSQAAGFATGLSVGVTPELLRGRR